MKKIVGLFLVIFSIVLVSNAASMNVYTVNLQAIIKEHPDTKKNNEILVTMQKELEKQRDSLLQGLKDKEDELKKIYESLKNPILNDKVKNEKRAELLAKERAFNEEMQKTKLKVADLQKELSKKELELFKELMTSVNTVLEDFVKKYDCDLIIDSSAINVSLPTSIVIYSSDKADITEEVIEKVKALEVK